MEEREGQLLGYEFKWSGIAKAPKLWLDTYPEATFAYIHSEDYMSFITGETVVEFRGMPYTAPCSGDVDAPISR